MNTDTQGTRKSGLSTAAPAATDQGSEQPPVRAEEDSRTRAARRAAELREHIGDDDGGVDEFFIDPRIIPEGWSYEWKRLTVKGEPDPTYEVALANKGWEPVPAYRHPELMPKGWKGETITRRGQILMERPLEITNEVKSADYRRATGQVRAKEEQLTGVAAHAGAFDARNKGQSMQRVHKAREATLPMPIPEK